MCRRVTNSVLRRKTFSIPSQTRKPRTTTVPRRDDDIAAGVGGPTVLNDSSRPSPVDYYWESSGYTAVAATGAERTRVRRRARPFTLPVCGQAKRCAGYERQKGLYKTSDRLWKHRATTARRLCDLFFSSFLHTPTPTSRNKSLGGVRRL